MSLALQRHQLLLVLVPVVSGLLGVLSASVPYAVGVRLGHLRYDRSCWDYAWLASVFPRRTYSGHSSV